MEGRVGAVSRLVVRAGFCEDRMPSGRTASRGRTIRHRASSRRLAVSGGGPALPLDATPPTISHFHSPPNHRPNANHRSSSVDEVLPRL